MAKPDEGRWDETIPAVLLPREWEKVPEADEGRPGKNTSCGEVSDPAKHHSIARHQRLPRVPPWHFGTERDLSGRFNDS